MDTYSIIKQLTEKLSNSSLEEERIRALIPIDHVMDIDSEGFVFHCQFSLSDDQNTIRSQIRDLNLITIEDEELYKVLAEIGKVDFTEYLNKEIFNYIQSKYQIANKKGAWNKTNMWFKPNQKFLEWFELKGIDPESESGGIPDFLSNWAKKVVRLLLKNGEMKHQDIILDLDGLPQSYNHISKIFKTPDAKEFFNSEIVNNNSYYSLREPSRFK